MARACISTSTLLAEVAHDDHLELQEEARLDRLAWEAEYVTLCDEMQAEEDAFLDLMRAEDDAYRAKHAGCPDMDHGLTQGQIEWAKEIATRFDLDAMEDDDLEDLRDSYVGKAYITAAASDRNYARQILYTIKLLTS